MCSFVTVCVCACTCTSHACTCGHIQIVKLCLYLQQNFCECAGSPAEKAGIQVGQIIVAINGMNVLTASHDAIINAMNSSKCAVMILHHKLNLLLLSVWEHELSALPLCIDSKIRSSFAEASVQQLMRKVCQQCVSWSFFTIFTEVARFLWQRGFIT